MDAAGACVIGSGGGDSGGVDTNGADEPNWNMYIPFKFTPESIENVNPLALLG